MLGTPSPLPLGPVGPIGPGRPLNVPIPAMMRWAVLIQSGGALQDGLRQAYQNTNWYYASVYAELNRSGLPVEPQSASALGPAWHMQPPPPKL